jgi:hypothetical protein
MMMKRFLPLIAVLVLVTASVPAQADHDTGLPTWPSDIKAIYPMTIDGCDPGEYVHVKTRVRLFDAGVSFEEAPNKHLHTFLRDNTNDPIGYGTNTHWNIPVENIEFAGITNPNGNGKRFDIIYSGVYPFRRIRLFTEWTMFGDGERDVVQIIRVGCVKANSAKALNFPAVIGDPPDQTH